eukprot:TRINITY_DN19226_c0_g1::TRINITY_DN19226_c0_g1_i1::g.2324::m.2324 TRINITY_DN19226_c0_g1::TRINITY_DN19226_c0_g1_i1::g.2324  ORF type:complete len:665 (-),score=108.58,sp/Q9BRS2/RIOK1_HUMAN/51.99/3e-140,RIO1/PF01163.17/3e-78,RIO1/PF01163.17/2.3e+03,APH/PF01636.18/1.4,APH/PF01636.18/0.32,Kdo/PF06293.9/2.4,Kdo/PF06293.9/0.3,Pkinase/PF00069.20/0.0069 TRINITY_DN19226_c0_g1_i1:421-2367(-)
MGSAGENSDDDFVPPCAQDAVEHSMQSLEVTEGDADQADLDEGEYYDDDTDDSDFENVIMGYEWAAGEGEGRDFTKKLNALREGRVGNATSSAADTAVKEPMDQKLLSRINVGRLDATVSAAVSKADRASEKSRIRHTDKEDRATMELVLDPRTRMILFKMLSNGFINQVNGCVSTGKEANVYHATNEAGSEFAIKIYKTSILVFKDRDRYVSGEFRFRHGYSKKNPRKMVSTWAEKELRNLKRLQTSGIPCPEPVLLRSHVLVMKFLGQDGWPAPRLKDAQLSGSKLESCYTECVKTMRRMYHDCHLVHADLSEYNILWHEGKPFFIDVSQSVEHDHPHALDFLRMDCRNMTDFFVKKGLCTMTPRELFNFVSDVTIKPDEVDDYLTLASQRATERAARGQTADEEVADAVFQQAYIPRTLDEVRDIERDVQRIKAGDLEHVYYAGLTGITTQDKVATTQTLAPESQAQDSHPQESIPTPTPASTSTSTSTAVPSLPASITGVSGKSATEPRFKGDMKSRSRKTKERALKASRGIGITSDDDDDDMVPLESVVTKDDSIAHDNDHDNDENDDSGVSGEEDNTESGSEGEGSDGSGSSDEDTSKMTKEERKEHKRRIKEENREKRKTKVPKAVKKRKQTLARRARGQK